MIVPAFTWVATANVVVYCGATPVFADVDARTYNIDSADVAAAVTAANPRGRRGAPVRPVRGHRRAACRRPTERRHGRGRGLRGRAPRWAAGRPAASATSAAFSFHPRKSITTGEGGMVTTDDPAIAERVHVLRSHGAGDIGGAAPRGPCPYLLPEFDEIGFNYRMSDLQAAVGLVQLGRLDEFIDERDRLAELLRARSSATSSG